MIQLRDLKAANVAQRINLCPDSSEFILAVNRAIDWLLIHGNWWGTVVDAAFRVNSGCFTTPGVVASVEAIRACGCSRFVQNGWYSWLPGWQPWTDCGSGASFESFGTLPTIETWEGSKILRSFASQPTDYGKTITFLGDDANGIWVRTQRTDGTFGDGEVVTLASPFVDTVTEFSTIASVVKDVTDGPVRVFGQEVASGTLTPVGVYEYWETTPNYQRYKVHGLNLLNAPRCCARNMIEAKVKLNFQKVQRDDDILRISNLPAMELALEALKAKDDGDLAKADLLMFGNGRNQRLGAIPLLQQELRTYTSDRFSGTVAVHGTAALSRVMRGFI